MIDLPNTVRQYQYSRTLHGTLFRSWGTEGDRRSTSEAQPQYLALSASPDQDPSRNIPKSRLTTTSASTAPNSPARTSTATSSSAFTHTCSQSLLASVQSHSLSLIGLCVCICTELVRSLRRGVVVHQPTHARDSKDTRSAVFHATTIVSSESRKRRRSFTSPLRNEPPSLNPSSGKSGNHSSIPLYPTHISPPSQMFWCE